MLKNKINNQEHQDKVLGLTCWLCASKVQCLCEFPQGNIQMSSLGNMQNPRVSGGAWPKGMFTNSLWNKGRTENEMALEKEAYGLWGQSECKI